MESFNVKNPDKYEGISVEYPPKPNLGNITDKDLEGLGTDQLYQLIQKRYGILKEDVLKKEKKSKGGTYNEKFF